MFQSLQRGPRPTLRRQDLEDHRIALATAGILAGVVIAWLEIFNELSATLVLYTGATRTLPIAAYQQAFGGDFGVAAVYSSLLILITAITLGLALKLGKMDEQNF